MCQLLGMNCATPTDFNFSFKGFCRRGGATDIHSHGWGLAIYEGRGLRTFLDTMPAAESPIASMVQRYPIRTYNMLAHIRYATQGEVSLENVHPFSRELWGIQWCFAHNGDVPKAAGNNDNTNQPPLLGKTKAEDITYHPVGDTDSESIFCSILNALKVEFKELPTLTVLHQFLKQLCDEIIQTNFPKEIIFNFLLGCGQYTTFAYSWPGKRPGSQVWNGLYYIVREPPFRTAQLIDVDYSIDFASVTTPNDRVAVITTKPLTNEKGWKEFKKGELLMFDKGLPYSKAETCEIVEREGRGLYSKCFTKRATSSPTTKKQQPLQQQQQQRCCCDERLSSTITLSDTTCSVTSYDSDSSLTTDSEGSNNGRAKESTKTFSSPAATTTTTSKTSLPLLKRKQ